MNMKRLCQDQGFELKLAELGHFAELELETQKSLNLKLLSKEVDWVLNLS